MLEVREWRGYKVVSMMDWVSILGEVEMDSTKKIKRINN